MANNNRKLSFGCIVVALLLLLVCSPVFGSDSIVSPLNGKILEPSEAPPEYSFLVAGHIYGAPESPSVFPAASFLANIDMINQSGAKFLVLTGDIIGRATPLHISNFKTSVCSSIQLPVFNAVGNHDIAKRQLYESNFGQTYYYFRYGNELYIILDGQIDNGGIAGKQWEWLKGILHYATEVEDVKNVFLFSHSLVWSKNDDSLSRIVYPRVNSHQNYENIDDFKSRAMPEIVQLSKAKKVFMVSGDIGISGSLPLFYHEDVNHEITYIACGLGDTDKDAIIRVDIQKEGEVTFTPISLTGEKLEEIELYGLDFWDEDEEGITYGKLLDKTQRVLTNIYFQLGIAFSLVVLSIVIGGFILFKKSRKR